MSWPQDEAQKLYERVKNVDRPVLFETGYGPSGLPHIGTFTEVARTSWVRQAFIERCGLQTKLLAFSDDMDGLRRIPDNIPNRERLEPYIGMPLCEVPCPYLDETDEMYKHESFSSYNNGQLLKFLDRFGFDYEFASSAVYYKSGRFNHALFRVLECHDEIVDVILPTLGKDRAATYSPLMPVHPRSGKIIQNATIIGIDTKTGIIIWSYDDEHFETSVFNGKCKLQWKADWAMRWHALGVDYEMSGKDLIDSVKLSSQICKILGSEPPINLTYELFLDEKGQKISKSKGNGLSVEEWLKYGPKESLAHYIFANPQRAKKLYFELIPRATDEYLANLVKAASQTGQELFDNPVWYIHGGNIPSNTVPIGFGMLLNLAGVANTEHPSVLLEFVRRYAPDTEPSPFLIDMIDKAIAYYRDFIKPKKVYRAPTELEHKALTELVDMLSLMEDGIPSEEIQTNVFTIGKQFSKMKDWFDCLYQVLLGQTEGPRFGVFISLYGRENTIKLIEEKLL
jgi:lysyl-tRNA synthetase class 1